MVRKILTPALYASAAYALCVAVPLWLREPGLRERLRRRPLPLSRRRIL